MYTHFADLDSRLIVLSCIEDANTFTCVVTVVSKTGRCPKCQYGSHKRHSAYMRVIDDLPIQGKSVQLYLKTHKWFCTNSFCEAKVFVQNASNGSCPIDSERSVWMLRSGSLLSPPIVSRRHMSLECWVCR